MFFLLWLKKHIAPETFSRNIAPDVHVILMKVWVGFINFSLELHNGHSQTMLRNFEPQSDNEHNI